MRLWKIKYLFKQTIKRFMLWLFEDTIEHCIQREMQDAINALDAEVKTLTGALHSAAMNFKTMITCERHPIEGEQIISVRMCIPNYSMRMYTERQMIDIVVQEITRQIVGELRNNLPRTIIMNGE